MSGTKDSSKRDEAREQFIRWFHDLKDHRNNRYLDEPGFDEAVWQWHLQQIAKVEQEAIKTLELCQQRMRPMILLDQEEGDNFAMYWDDKSQTWSRARYKDLITEAKRQLAAGLEEEQK